MSSKTNYRESIRQEILSLIKNEGDRRRSGSVVVLPPHHAETPAAPKGFTVGHKVYFFLPHPYKGQKQNGIKNAGADPWSFCGCGWTEPFFLSHRNRTLLVAAEVLRYVFFGREEAIAVEAVTKTAGVGSLTSDYVTF